MENTQSIVMACLQTKIFQFIVYTEIIFPGKLKSGNLNGPNHIPDLRKYRPQNPRPARLLAVGVHGVRHLVHLPVGHVLTLALPCLRVLHRSLLCAHRHLVRSGITRLVEVEGKI